MHKRRRKKIICVDFDGVIHSYVSGWKGIDVIHDQPVPGAVEWLNSHANHPDFRIVIYSSRSATQSGCRAMMRWLLENGVSAVSSDGADGTIAIAHEKPAAFLTIDDRSICFDGVFPSDDEINCFKPWYAMDSENESGQGMANDA